jgi:hypothetical protein
LLSLFSFYLIYISKQKSEKHLDFQVKDLIFKAKLFEFISVILQGPLPFLRYGKTGCGSVLFLEKIRGYIPVYVFSGLG